MKKLFIEYV